MIKMLKEPRIFTLYLAYYIIAVSVVVINGETYTSFTLGIRLFKWEFMIGINDHHKFIIR